MSTRAKVVLSPLLGLDHQVEDRAIGRHVQRRSIPYRFKVVIDENATHFSDWLCHDRIDRS
jgi:hypothetical protein